MCPTAADAHTAIDEMMSARRFGDAGRRVVIEEWLQGEEASYFAISDGTRIVMLAAAQDHKRANDGDEGENTGGMGAYSPAPVVTEAVEKKILERIVHPTIRGMAREGHPYQGVLFVGLMIDGDGDPYVIEFNVRFGDPETQALMVRMQSDLLPVLAAAARGELSEGTAIEWREAAVCVVLASAGYPREYATGKRIDGLAVLEREGQGAHGLRAASLVVFHAGTRRAADGRGFETAGGRVLGITARGDSVAEACARAYQAVARIRLRGHALPARHRRARATALVLAIVDRSSPPASLPTPPDRLDPSWLDPAVAQLAADGVIAYPTETVWGLGACADRAQAIERLFAWKGRAHHQPLAVLVASPAAATALGCELDAHAHRLAEQFWPGPLMLITPCHGRFAPGVAREDGALGLRCSPHPVARALTLRLAREGLGPLTSTSLNRSGDPPARRSRSGDPGSRDRLFATASRRSDRSRGAPAGCAFGLRCRRRRPEHRRRLHEAHAGDPARRRDRAGRAGAGVVCMSPNGSSSPSTE